MSISRRQLIKFAGSAGLFSMTPGLLLAQKLEKTSVHIAVGGKVGTYYQALSIAEQLGYFKDEGLDVKISDFAGGAKSLQAVVGGSADVVSGAFEHTINLQAKGQFFRCVVLQGRCPMMTMGVSKKNMANFKTGADLKGKKIGVTAPGSSTNMLASFYLAKHGLKVTDASYVGVGTGAGAITAIREGNIDAISNIDPVITALEESNDIQVIADTRRIKDTIEIFGGNMPAGSLYLPQSYIDANPKTIQALVNAMVRADKWIVKAGPAAVTKALPASYFQGNPDLYTKAVEKCMEAMSPDGMIPSDGPATALKALAAYSNDIRDAKIDLDKTWTNDFAKRANEKYPDVKV
ncbi:NitT/TauT family transport system substrate-binding protein [Jezberella montanilacus]|uniref:NitT/TauT family transport system substrate-binding protein n=1 Tax=Jezberella montanilacus TaxID=323426 RepID=A0A2T0XKX5_9BURK|nr:ABC transporter substrate-binding protein [Jezberella montanilacus]PRY99550.1 NitT/TauT family transport system substrate-binding protein [Jezberella montanilacus]